MIALPLLVAPLLPVAPDEVTYVDASLELDGRLLSWEITEGLGEGRVDLVLAVRRQGRRELRVHALAGVRVDPVPRRVVPILDDVVAWGSAELRADPGRELLLLTPGGAFSYSLTRDGYRDNAQALARAELIYDIADAQALPRWRYVLPGLGADGRDGLLLPERDGLSLWDSGTGEGARYGERARFSRGTRAPGAVLQVSSDGGLEREEGRVRRGTAREGPFLLGAAGTLLDDAHSYRAPALVDLDGNGRLDLVDFDGKRLWVHRDCAQEPSRVEELPAYLNDGDAGLALAFHDLDGDGDLDLLAHLRGTSSGLKNTPQRLLVLLNDGRRHFPETPHQVLRFEAAALRAEVADVDGDGRPDLVVRIFSLPTALQAVTGPEFTLTHLIFFGEPEGFARQAGLRHEERFDESGAGAALANRRWVLDCDGDGIADLCAVDLSGRLSVRRLKKRSSFLRGTRWELDPSPWRTFDTRGSIGSFEVRDLNGDGLGDLVSAGEERLAIFLSQRRRGGR